MDRPTLELIINILEDKHMLDAAIEILEYEGKDIELVTYFKFLKGDNLVPDISQLDEERTEKINRILQSRESGPVQSMTVTTMEAEKNIETVNRAIDFFNEGQYSEAEKKFRESLRDYRGTREPIILTYLSLCQYKLEEHTEALKTMNRAIDMEPWNEEFKKIRDGIIDGLEGLENKSKFMEEYYTRGTVVGEILRHSMELYQKIDNIDVENKSIIGKIKGFFSEARRLYDNERYSLERDLMNVEQFIVSGEKQMSLYLEDEEIKNFVRQIEKYNLGEEIEKVLRIAETLYARMEKDKDVDYSHLVFLYSKVVEMLCRDKILPYFNKMRGQIPSLEGREDYNRIGIRSFDVGGLVRYSFNNSFSIEGSLYLQEITRNNLLRKEYKGKEHIMPWDKLKFIAHCIKTGKDPIDGTKSAGMLLLFFVAYKNYLKMVHSFKDEEEIIYLSGNLIRLQNERNSLVHSKILEDREAIEEYRRVSLDCIERLSKIEALKCQAD